MNKHTIASLLLLLVMPLLLNFILDNSGVPFQQQVQNISQYKKWKSQYSMSFDHHEDKYRFFIFITNKLKIIQHNQKTQKSYEMGINKFAHLTQHQFQNLYLGIRTDNQKINLLTNQIQYNSNQININTNDQSILTDVDWQVLGKVSNVKNQGNCDSGYAFSSTSLIQSSMLVQNQNNSFSQQHIIDCADNYTTMGCNGGSRIGTLKFAKQKGLILQKSYPYTGLKGLCKNLTGNYKINFTISQSNGCNQIKSNLYKTPMTVAVNARNWQLYKAGIFDNCQSTDDVNHDIYLIGVSLTNWRLKNSWGLRWGQYGYIRLNLGNTCGICSRTAYGFII